MTDLPEATRRYVEENERVLALPVVGPSTPRVRTTGAVADYLVRSWHPGWGIVLAVRVLRRWPDLARLRSLRGSGRGRPALVLGNGPSQGFLRRSTLREFRARGDVYCVNAWTENRELSDVAPTCVTLSDPVDRVLGERQAVLGTAQARLAEYLHAHPDVRLLLPLDWVPDFRERFGDRCIGFNDDELRWTRNLNPLYPRGYRSMTVMKALAIALFAGHDPVFVLGIDNTYPRDLFCGPDGRLVNRERHAGESDYLDPRPDDVAGELFGLYQLFEDANHVARRARSAIVNLDPYSLTDAFPRVATVDAGMNALLGR